METNNNSNNTSEKDSRNDIEQLAQKLASLVPKETNFNNTKSSKYFSGKNIKQVNDSNCSTLRDTLTIATQNMPNRTHKKSLSKTYYIINHNKIVNKIEVNFEKTSTQKVSYKIPSKQLEYEEVECEDLESDINNIKSLNEKQNEDSYIDSNQFEIDLNSINRLDSTDNESLQLSIDWKIIYQIITEIWENLIKNFDNLTIFLAKHRENLELIEKWFDLTSKIDFFGCNGKVNFDNICSIIKNLDSIKDYNILTKVKQNMNLIVKQSFFSEVITLGFIINLYDIIKHKSIIGNMTETIFYNNLKSCLTYVYQNFIILTYALYERHISSNKNKLTKSLQQGDEYLILCRSKFDENRILLNKNTYIKYLINNNQVINNILRKNTEKLTNFYNKYNKESNIKYENILNNDNITDIKNLEYTKNCLNNIEKIKYEDIREMVYNEYLLGNLVKINLLYKEDNNDNDSGSEVETDDTNYNKQINSLSNYYLPQKDKKVEYTLVVDLDETLVHYMEEGNEAFVQVRPYAEYFLNEMSKYFEIVIFTAATEEVFYN